MKFTQTGTFKENFLEETTTLNIKKNISSILLDKLDYFIGFITNEQTDIVAKFIQNLLKKYQDLIEQAILKTMSNDFQVILTKYVHLIKYPDLNLSVLNYLLHLFHIKEKESMKELEVTMSMRSLIQAWTYPSYYLLETLIETIGRDEATRLFKRYITGYYLDHPSPNRDEFTLEKMLDKRLSGDTSSSGWVMVHTMLEEGKYAFKNKNCPTCVDSMTDLPDVEIKYLACCYGDYEKFRSIYSDHIVLTMEHTIMEGDAYCSRVLHDTRINYDLSHPLKEFWDNFEPGNESVAAKYYKE